MSQPRTAGRLARAVDLLQSRALGLAPVRTRYTVDRGVRVPTRDGAVLVSDHYAPTGVALGTVLIRTPYGRGLPVSLFHGRMLAGRGYHVIVQSVRGTGGSTGDFRPIVQEAADAQDAVAWLRAQSWFDGRLATLGGSYLGWAQWALLEDPPSELCASVIMVGPHDFGRAVRGSGALALADFLSWSATVEAQGVGGLRGVREMVAARKRTAAALSTPSPAGDIATTALGGRGAWFHEWLAHDDLGDPYWAPYGASSVLKSVSVPTLLIGGWQDVFLEQTIEQYLALSGHNPEVGLTVGPWTHLDTAVKASKVADAETLTWLDRHLGNRGTGRQAKVRIYVTGAEEWRSLSSWPPKTAEWALYPNTDGRLAEDPHEGLVEFHYDPGDPTPAVGGRHMSPGAGSRDNRKLEEREDVITFTSDPLPGNLEVFGVPRLRLGLRPAAPDSGIFVRVCDVDTRGRSWNVSETFHKLDGPGKAVVETSPCAHRFRAGHRIRLQISGGAYPRYDRNPNSVSYLIDCGDSSLHLPTGNP
ncbi:CocE/NonD family hydrolase [Amycolatopsis sp.]|uniref:CocE/NonD family hydrolase n=1 Tax=Amycolatopsis sp. TaxID=37632 RepID=UPI002E04DF1F|nr:CocE/NonD family hydrolase [Amycolatopsis sp.]